MNIWGGGKKSVQCVPLTGIEIMRWNGRNYDFKNLEKGWGMKRGVDS